MTSAGYRPAHHPGEDLLAAYASGAAAEAVALLVATHLALCPRCRADVARLESVGGALLGAMEPAAVGDSLLEETLARLDESEPASAPAAPPPAAVDPETAAIPQPLRGYLGEGLGALSWKRRGPVFEAQLAIGRAERAAGGYTTRLLRIPGGRGTPLHTHRGQEYTLVLAGAYADALGHYARGDVATADPQVEHRPVADPGEDCLCLAVTDAPLVLTGPVGRLLNPFIKA